jgi:predicted ATPase
MAYPDAWIYSFSAKGINRMRCEETEHYRITRDFLSNPPRMLRILIADDDQSPQKDPG